MVFSDGSEWVGSTFLNWKTQANFEEKKDGSIEALPANITKGHDFPKIFVRAEWKIKHDPYIEKKHRHAIHPASLYAEPFKF